MNENYYTAHKKAILAYFDRSVRDARPVANALYEPEVMDAVIWEARGAFERMLPRLPYVGGRKNPLTVNLYGSAGALAFFKTALAHDIPLEKAGEILYCATERRLSRVPRLLRRVMGRAKFGKRALDKARREADASQRREYPGDWVFTFVEGDGISFDYGIDFTECGVCKFAETEGQRDAVKYLCPLDFPMCQAFGMGLERTTTIAEGGKKCDFRCKRGRETPPGWPPGFMKER